MQVKVCLVRAEGMRESELTQPVNLPAHPLSSVVDLVTQRLAIGIRSTNVVLTATRKHVLFERKTKVSEKEIYQKKTGLADCLSGGVGTYVADIYLAVEGLAVVGIARAAVEAARLWEGLASADDEARGREKGERLRTWHFGSTEPCPRAVAAMVRRTETWKMCIVLGWFGRWACVAGLLIFRPGGEFYASVFVVRTPLKRERERKRRGHQGWI